MCDYIIKRTNEDGIIEWYRDDIEHGKLWVAEIVYATQIEAKDLRHVLSMVGGEAVKLGGAKLN